MIQHLVENCKCLRDYFEHLGAALGSNGVSRVPVLLHVSAMSPHGRVPEQTWDAARGQPGMLPTAVFLPLQPARLLSPCQSSAAPAGTMSSPFPSREQAAHLAKAIEHNFLFPCHKPIPGVVLMPGACRERSPVGNNSFPWAGGGGRLLRTVIRGGTNWCWFQCESSRAVAHDRKQKESESSWDQWLQVRGMNAAPSW